MHQYIVIFYLFLNKLRSRVEEALNVLCWIIRDQDSKVLYMIRQFQLCLTHNSYHRFNSIRIEKLCVLREDNVPQCQSFRTTICRWFDYPIKMIHLGQIRFNRFVLLHAYKQSVYIIPNILTRNNINMKLIIAFFLIYLSVAEGITYTEIQQKMRETLTSPFVNLMFVYDSAAQKGRFMGVAIEEIGKRKEGYFKIIPVDCNTDDTDVPKNFPYCQNKIRSKLPALMYIEPSLNSVNPQSGEAIEPRNHQYQGQLQEKALYDFAVPLMKLYSVILKKVSDWIKFKQNYPQTPKVLYFTDKDKISPFFKSLTAHFRNTIAFAHVFKNSSLCEELGVTSFPTLLLNGKEKIELTTNLIEQVQLLKPYEGQQTNITIQEYQELTSELTFADFQEKILNNPRHILLHIPAADGTTHPQWKKTQQSFKRMFDYFEGPELAKDLGIKHRPAIIYYPKSLTKKQLKKTVFYANNNFRSIYDQISNLIEDFTVPLSSGMEMQQLTGITLGQGRFVVILFHKEEISLSYRVLSNDERFKEGLDFFRMKDPPAEVVKQFQLKKLPALLVMIVDKDNTTKAQNEEEVEQGKKAMNLQVAHYTGKFNYDDLQKYMNVFVQAPKKQEEVDVKDIKEIKSKKGFENQCLEECYLLLIDGSEEKKDANTEYINTLKRSVANTYQNVGYFDGKCHSEILSKLQIYNQDLPVLIFLNSKFQKYSRLVGRIEQKAIQSFIVKVKSNKGIWRAYDKFTFQNKDCQKQHERLKQLQTTGFEMSAEQAQILQQIKQQEQKRKQQAAAGDKDSKKKRRKRRPKQEQSEL